ncbi:MAG: hypothetical protein EGQ26_00405 [Clostridiales bacterium]|nr:hypothetical protein [Clostridiales bacterium]
MQYHLSTADPGVESYPEAASSLVSESGYCIRYILYETADTITARSTVTTAIPATGCSPGRRPPD